MSKSRCTVLVTALLLTGLSGGAVSADKSFHGARTNQLILRLADDSVRRIQSAGRGQVVPGIWLPDGRELKLVRHFGEDAVVVELPESLGFEEARALAAQLTAQAGVVAAEPDKRYFPAYRPNDPLYLGPELNSIDTPGQWNLFESIAGINMEAGWDISRGLSSVTVAILDTGIIAHSDLDDRRVLPGYDFITDPFTANDNDGLNSNNSRDPDPTDPGDWVELGAECFVGDPERDRSSWHGLSVTGVIATCLGFASAERELLDKLQKYRG